MGLWPSIQDPRRHTLKSDDMASKWDILIQAPTREDFDRLAYQLIPKKMITARPSIECHKDLRYGKPMINDIIPYTDRNRRPYRSVPIIERYFERFVNVRPDDRQRCPSLCLVGYSGSGKTDYIRRMGPHAYFNGEVQAKRMNPEALFMLFDDVKSRKYEGYRGWKLYWGCQKWLGTRDLNFRGNVEWGRPCIFTVNRDMDPRLDIEYDTDFLSRNCIIVDIEEQLYQNMEGTLPNVYMPKVEVPVVAACNIDLDFLKA
ncbi:hypothetical protein L873DRAFT_1006343 [Choiromyces venosus 120613-1]|uniref:Uncharacterized protein n=1 Tax=Choiromyces venosus 120613-1 TaxID=1336337 RepID=A0A3N4JPH0_9PEZI|nr:hypothetical protein L873DRAFT_1006343 [Choiromyces venosus 120613-1]